MICPVCQDKPHRLEIGGSTSTLMYSTPWYENGVYHSHDGNRHSSSYRCSNGHHIGVSSYSPCPAGDYDRETVVRVTYKCEVCTTFNLESPDAETCSYCEYRRKDELRKAKDEVARAYRALPGWQRRRKSIGQYMQEVRAYAAQGN